MKSPNFPRELAKKTKKLSSFIAMEVLQEVQTRQSLGEDVISFSIGEPDFPAPKAAKKAAIDAIKEDFTQYTHSLGLPELREAIAQDYQQRYGVHIDAKQVIVTSGTSPAMLLGFGALLNPGDEVLMSDPHYPCYKNFIHFFEAKPNYVRLRESDGFQYDPEAFRKKITRKTKAILASSPANPTGVVIKPETLKELASMGKYIISDEIYHGLTYEGRDHSILEFTDHAFVFNGFSKAYSMTGFRLGYMIAPKEFLPVLEKMQQNFYISTSSFIQRAGLAALQHGKKEQAKMKKIFKQRRQVMLEGVKKLGFKVAAEPQGAFYIFANAKHLSKDSYRFAMDILKHAKVGITPGIDFGKSGEGFVRFSYAVDVKRIKEGLRRIEKYLAKNF